MNADYAVIKDLAILWFSSLWRLPVVLFGIAAWLMLICIENFYLIIDWFLDCGTIHTLLIIKKYLFNIKNLINK